MKAFFKYIITIVLIVGVASTLLFYAVNSGLRRQKIDMFGKLNELILGHEKLDIIFIGSSRVNLTINPKIIDSLTGSNSFNFGIDAANIVDYGMHLKAYLKTHEKPKLVVLNIDPKMFNITSEVKYPAKYLPYIGHPEIYDTLKEYSHLPIVAKYMPFVATSFYSDDIVNQAFQAYTSPNRTMENYYKGFSPLKKIWNRGDSTAKDLWSVAYTNKGLSLFKTFLEEAKKNNINLRLIYSPQYYSEDNDKKFRVYLSMLNEFVKPYNQSIQDFTTLDICKDKNLFFDATHLNINGANRFSVELAKGVRINY